jgi:hypothetical protein
MKDFFIDAGELREHITILDLQETSPGTWEWVASARSKAAIELGSGKNLFSSVGIGARDAKLILRRQPITEHQAILWSGKHLFVSSITPQGRRHLEISAALVDTVICKAETFKNALGKGNRPVREPGPVINFSGILTEKYLGYDKEDSHAVSTVTYVLVTPKPIALSEGDLVEVVGFEVSGDFNIVKCHRLDAFKNEYEMTRRRDV